MEWVQDWYDGDYYNSSPRVDPPGPLHLGSARVFRGGDFLLDFRLVRSAYRGRNLARLSQRRYWRAPSQDSLTL